MTFKAQGYFVLELQREFLHSSLAFLGQLSMIVSVGGFVYVKILFLDED